MAYDYLDITNEVLARMNEVELTSSNFVSGARGFQVQCKNAVNDAVNYVNQREFGWPFSHATSTVTLVAIYVRLYACLFKTFVYFCFIMVHFDIFFVFFQLVPSCGAGVRTPSKI